VVYMGDRICLHNLLVVPANSILAQASPTHARFTPSAELEKFFDSNKHLIRNHLVNGDGFGISWYSPHKKESAIYKSLLPAWNDRNFRELCDGIVSDNVFAHVRAASPGSALSRENCHPFKYGRYTFMHNGGIAAFKDVRRKLRALVKDPLYQLIEGSTDTETAFALFLDCLPDVEEAQSPEVLVAALQKTIALIVDVTKSYGPSSLNFAVTDGTNVLVTRYRNCPDEEPPTLYLAFGSEFTIEPNGELRMAEKEIKDTICISSEPLSYKPEDWKLIPHNTLVLARPVANKQVVLMDPRERASAPYIPYGELSVTYFPIE